MNTFTEIIIRAVVAIVAIILGCAHVNNIAVNIKAGKHNAIGAPLMLALLWIFVLAKVILSY